MAVPLLSLVAAFLLGMMCAFGILIHLLGWIVAYTLQYMQDRGYLTLHDRSKGKHDAV